MSEAAESKVFRLSKRLAIEMTVGVGGFVVEWDPRIPAAGLTTKEWRAYRQARHEMLTRLAGKIGGNILVVET